MVWYYLFSFVWYGETLFHVLTCVEHYLAVVHPVVYLSLRKRRAIMVRNLIIGCIWLFSFGMTIIIILKNYSLVMDLCLLTSSMIVMSFCSLSVLCALIRPGPGDQGRVRERVDQSKQRALYTTVVILVVLLLRCAWNLLWTIVDLYDPHINQCVWFTTEIWINLPGSLVLPLLFLHRTGILMCCKNNTK